MNRRENDRLIGAIDAAREAGQRMAIATVVRVRGSAYRREGARIVVREDGSYECLLSGGCLEPAVAEAAARVLESGQPLLVGPGADGLGQVDVGVGGGRHRTGDGRQRAGAPVCEVRSTCRFTTVPGSSSTGSRPLR